MEDSWKLVECLTDELRGNELNPIGKEIILFGAGLNALEVIEDLGSLCKIQYIWDNYYEGASFQGYEVKKPNSNSDLKNFSVLIATAARNYREITEQIKPLNIPFTTYFQYLFMTERGKFKKVYDTCLCDSYSKELYSQLIISKLKMDYTYIKSYMDNQYFALPEFSGINPGENIVDCGAYVGDFLEQYVIKSLGGFHSIYAFEPNIKSFRAMKIRCKRLQEEWALDESQFILKCEACNFKAQKGLTIDYAGAASKVGTESGMQTNAVSLDEVIEEKIKISFIKADVEGSEMDLLRGAERIIRMYKPRLAITIYHKQKDYFEIPLYIKSLVPEYKMSIRRHSTNYNEVVLYCYV